MYKGDGSFKHDNSQEVSFIEILNKEAEIVDNYNSSIRAYSLAKRNNLRTGEYTEDIERYKQKLSDVRQEIRDYIENKLRLEIVDE